MIKALFFDIDGTLISFKTHEIPPSTIEAIVAAKAKGIQIFIATGRPRALINNLGALNEHQLIDGYITMNGAYCFVGEEVIYKSAIPHSDVEALCNFCAMRNISCIVVDEHTVKVCQPSPHMREIFHERLKVTAPIPPIETEEAIRDKQIFQLTAFINEEEEKQVLASISQCEIGRWHPDFADITALGNTKQKGIDEIISRFGIRLEDTMAFGDGGNDISMLRHVGTGIAMGNAKDDVKAAAHYVTTSVDDDGIRNALIHFGVIDQ